ncbi:hypothetical protein [Kutzneria buriramensis]|uniref:Uncharacterized protein n=1 Tax=Kutzneria buriramensis TaxID=1045776 RepID=A0A3E0G7P3_9PSEU|nr:hypothetical protein [Kutzneria buriramensis]REH18078.1 hypothetical protein BCF44_13865 [Kutzneria buriramensis]
MDLGFAIRLVGYDARNARDAACLTDAEAVELVRADPGRGDVDDLWGCGYMGDETAEAYRTVLAASVDELGQALAAL